MTVTASLWETMTVIWNVCAIVSGFVILCNSLCLQMVCGSR